MASSNANLSSTCSVRNDSSSSSNDMREQYGGNLFLTSAHNICSGLSRVFRRYTSLIQIKKVTYLSPQKTTPSTEVRRRCLLCLSCCHFEVVAFATTAGFTGATGLTGGVGLVGSASFTGSAGFTGRTGSVPSAATAALKVASAAVVAVV